ncbi:MAG: SurA N-terminal domain-containing protein, partial [Patescibacteria group bacterium]|nr:SurA N-terminal domain-containing protein [Patescibacteria group bacterium]
MIIQKFVKKISKKKRVVLGVVGALVFVIAVIVFTGISIYVLKWENCFFTNGIARVIPYPAMRVNGDFIRFSDYQKDISTLVKFYAYEADVAGLPVPKYETIRINILERLKRNKIIEQVAEREGIVITKEELDAEFYKIMVRAGSPETVEDTLKNFYGWNEKEFKKRIVWSVLLQE